MELKDMLNQMDKKFRDPESKNKIKQLKKEAHGQIDRNKIILKELINKYHS
jgi:Ca2+-binding EF-hand superfamily protein